MLKKYYFEKQILFISFLYVIIQKIIIFIWGPTVKLRNWAHLRVISILQSPSAKQEILVMTFSPCQAFTTIFQVMPRQATSRKENHKLEKEFFFNIEENMAHGLSSCYQKKTENLPKIMLYTICSLLAAHSYNTTQWRSLMIRKHGLFDLYFAFILSD